MVWTFLLLLILPGGEVQPQAIPSYRTRAACETAREALRLQPLPKGVEGRLIGACGPVQRT